MQLFPVKVSVLRDHSREEEYLLSLNLGVVSQQGVHIHPFIANVAC